MILETTTDSRRESLIQAARDNYEPNSDCCIEIDDDAKISESDDGAWVAAWVFVRNEDL